MSQRSFIFYLISIFAILNLSGSSKSSKSSLAPDFAFPQTVEKNANHDLTSALDKKDWNGVACAVVKSITASNLISRENVVAGLSRLDSISNSAPADWKPVFLLMQADIYGKIYESNRWDMDSRELPLDSFPKNPFDWSKDLIALKTLQLCTPIVEYSRSAKNPVSEWSSFLVDTSFASSMRMTTGEFLNLRSFYLLNRMSDSSGDIIPFFTTSTLPVTPAQKCANLRDRAIDILIDQASSSGNQSELLGEAL